MPTYDIPVSHTPLPGSHSHKPHPVDTLHNQEIKVVFECVLLTTLGIGQALLLIPTLPAMKQYCDSKKK